jgi:hypothetical protein
MSSLLICNIKPNLTPLYMQNLGLCAINIEHTMTLTQTIHKSDSTKPNFINDLFYQEQLMYTTPQLSIVWNCPVLTKILLFFFAAMGNPIHE